MTGVVMEDKKRAKGAGKNQKNQGKPEKPERPGVPDDDRETEPETPD